MAEKGKLKASEYLKKWIPFAKMRYATYMFATVATLIIPWIKVNGNHFILLSFEDFKFHFLFIKFDMQELYLMPFLLMLLFVGIFGITVLGGRMFCGWFCPQTIFRVIYRDLIETKILGLRKRIANKQKDPDYSKPINQVKRVAAILIWTLLATIAASNLLWYFVPPEEFFKQIVHPSENGVLFGTLVGIVLFLVYDIIFLKENFCVYVCPYSRVQSVLYDDDTIMAIYDNTRGGKIYDGHEKTITKEAQLAPDDLCTTCESCVTVCPTHIDIRQGLQLECINCLECVDACTTVMAKFNEPSLVNWSSTQEIDVRDRKTNFLRPKIWGYGVILVGLLVGLVMMGVEKELMLMNVNKDSRLYEIEKVDGKVRVENRYTILIQNSQNEEHKFYLHVEGNDKIKIAQPSHPFTLKAGEQKKKSLVLYTTEMLAEDMRKDTMMQLTLKAYALDTNDTIKVNRDIRFTYPREDIILKRMK